MIKIFLDQISQPARAVLTVCKLGKVPFELHEIRLARKEVNLFELSINQMIFCKKILQGKFPLFMILRKSLISPKVIQS